MDQDFLWGGILLLFAAVGLLWTTWELKGVFSPKWQDTFSEWVRGKVHGKFWPTVALLGGYVVVVWGLAGLATWFVFFHEIW